MCVNVCMFVVAQNPQSLSTLYTKARSLTGKRILRFESLELDSIPGCVCVGGLSL